MAPLSLLWGVRPLAPGLAPSCSQLQHLAWLLGDVLQEVAQENDAERRGARLWHRWGVSGASWAEPWA